MANSQALTKSTPRGTGGRFLARFGGPVKPAPLAKAEPSTPRDTSAITKAPSKPPLVPHRQRQEQDGFTNIIGGELPTMLTVAGLGAADRSGVGNLVREKTGLDPSTVATGLAAVARLTNLDQGSPMARRIVTRTLKGMLSVHAFGAGGAAMDAVSRMGQRLDEEAEKKADAEPKKEEEKPAQRRREAKVEPTAQP